jgi:hypothetical protein
MRLCRRICIAMRVIDLAAVVRMIPVQPDLFPDRADRRRPAGADGPALPSPRSRPDARTGAGVSAKYISRLCAAMGTRDIHGMILDDRRSATVKSTRHSGSGRRATYSLEKPSAHPGYEHATVTRYPGGSWGEFRAPGRRGGGWLPSGICAGVVARYSPEGCPSAGSDWAESAYAIGSRVPSMAAWATSVRRRLWLRA